MNVFVLADDEQKEELLAQPVTKDILFHWLKDARPPVAMPAADACIDLLFVNTPERLAWLRQLDVSLVVINSVALSLGEIDENFIRINGWNTFLRRDIMEASCKNDSLKGKATQLFSALGRKAEWVPDICGFITPRVVSSIINEAFFALEEQVSAENEIDTAMKLGTNYPYGPFEWGQKIGLQRVYGLLETLSKEQNRYKPSSLLKKSILV